jgi:hypothetical protein
LYKDDFSGTRRFFLSESNVVGGDVMMLDLQSKVQKGLNSSKGYVNSDSNKDPLNRKDLNRRKKTAEDSTRGEKVQNEGGGKNETAMAAARVFAEVKPPKSGALIPCRIISEYISLLRK